MGWPRSSVGEPPPHVLIAGVSTRAAAESAARAGFRVTSIDAFADLDQHPSVRALTIPDYSPAAAARAARNIECDAVAYVSGFENHSGAVDVLSDGRALWGNRPEPLRRVRDPLTLVRAFRRGGHPAPAVRRSRAAGDWLVKPLSGGGGHDVRPYVGQAVGSAHYLQERVDGMPGSVAFVAAGGRAAILGVFRLLVGGEAFGAAGYHYCGSILAAEEDSALVEAAGGLARAAAAEFDLVGVNGIDFVARDRVPYPVELNPRWCASMELVARASGVGVFAVHAGACRTGALPERDFTQAHAVDGAVGKAVVFARRDLRCGDTRPWLESGAQAVVRDVPRPGAEIRAGRPICTVFAWAPDAAACHAALVRNAERIYARTAPWARAAAGNGQRRPPPAVRG